MQNQFINTSQSELIEETGSSLLAKKWLTGDEVVHLLRISKRTLQNYRDSRALPFSQYGRKILYKASDIHVFLESHYVKGYCQKGNML